METLFAVIGVLAVFTGVYFLVRNVVVRKRLTCPEKHIDVDVKLVRQGFSGEGPAVKVKSCSAFDNPRKVDCDQECLKEENAA